MYKTRTFEELVNHPTLENNQEVKCRINIDTFFKGKIVGVSSSGLISNYIVECTDGTFPNYIYGYKFLSLPLSEIFIEGDKMS